MVAVMDTALPASEAVALRTKVERIKRLSQRAQPSEGADFVQYELLIEDPGAMARIAFADDGSDKARELVDLVDAISETGSHWRD